MDGWMGGWANPHRYPLDGGRVLAAALVLKGVEANKAATIVAGTAGVLASGLVAWGVYGLVATREAHAVMSILVGVWILGSSKSLWDAGLAGTAEQHPLFATHTPSSSSAHYSTAAGNVTVGGSGNHSSGSSGGSNSSRKVGKWGGGVLGGGGGSGGRGEAAKPQGHAAQMPMESGVV
mmetsp:Transcript_59990/g.103338  ORF Transcript_59990/g.103338 Transcript_59990/m.103338 type:complete len:178 (+) Transcript_59990:552-1085(+)